MSSMRSASSRTSTEIAVERDEPALDEVLQPAGRGDEHVRAARELRLLAQGDAAVDRGGADRPGRGRCSSKASVTWTQSSRVGTSTSAAGAGPRGSSRSTIGIAKASVLPEPVGLLASTSPPRSASGMATRLHREGRARCPARRAGRRRRSRRRAREKRMFVSIRAPRYQCRDPAATRETRPHGRTGLPSVPSTVPARQVGRLRAGRLSRAEWSAPRAAAAGARAARRADRARPSPRG